MHLKDSVTVLQCNSVTNHLGVVYLIGGVTLLHCYSDAVFVLTFWAYQAFDKDIHVLLAPTGALEAMMCIFLSSKTTQSSQKLMKT